MFPIRTFGTSRLLVSRLPFRPLLIVRALATTNKAGRNAEPALEDGSILSETIRSLTAQGLPETSSAKGLVKDPLMKRIKDGALHYWHGSKLLAYETKISSRLLFKLLRGEALIRRERRQLLRTTSDLFRLVPFIVIAIIPFLEFALPVLLKLFPNMLPSTFEDKVAAEEKIRKQVKAKLEMAKFLQDAAESMTATGPISPQAREFSDLYKKARITGEPLTMIELEKVCHSLKDSLTIDNLDRAQLVSLCKYMGVKAFGTDSFLRYQIRKTLKSIYHDDVEIAREGVDALFPSELEAACRMRGLFFPGINTQAMRTELKHWLSLHLDKGIPSVLLILSRALSQNMSLFRLEEALKETILSLPDAVVNEAALHQQEIAGSGAVSFKHKLEVLEQQQEFIAEELAQSVSEEAQLAHGQDSLTKEELRKISDAVSVMSSVNPVEREKLELEELKADISDFKQNAVELESMTNEGLKESKAAEIIGRQLEKLVGELENELQSLQDKLGARLNLIAADEKGTISLSQLALIFKMIQRRPGEVSRLQDIIKTFDSDGDGKVLISDILEMHARAKEEEGHGVLVNDKND